MTTKKPQNCSHPQLCHEDNFRDRIKTEKLSLEAPPPDEIIVSTKKHNTN